jgi:hypothetical protein
MSSRKRVILGVTSIALALGAGYAIRAAASGIPATAALTYAGVLEDGNGAFNGPVNIELVLYDAATAGNNLCQSASVPLTLTNGHFAVPLPDTCTAAVGANPNVWVDVLVNGSDTGRTKIGAVPYAVEANHAVNATSATTAVTAGAASGALAQQIVPSGAVLAFNLSACPSGWSLYAAAGGRAVIGVNAAGGNGLSQRNLGDVVGEETHTMSVAEMPSHSHTLLIDQEAPACAGGYWGMTWGATQTCNATEPTLGAGLQNFMTVQAAGGGGPFNQMQPSVTLLYCQKS